MRKNFDLDEQLINLIVENYQKGYKFPPIVALRDGTVVDGAHRVEAARRLHLRVIEVVYIDSPIQLSNLDELKLWMDEEE